MYSGSLVAAVMPRIALRIAARSAARREPAAARATAGSIRRRYCSRPSSSLRGRMTRTISPPTASESCAWRETNVPPLRPRRASTRPAPSRMLSACWMVGRPTPNMTASSLSAGRASPGWIRRSAMWRRICSATYSCARNCWMRSKRTDVLDPLEGPLVPFLTATRGLLWSQLRDAGEEAIEEALAAALHGWGEAICLIEQSVGVDPIPVELVPVGLDPVFHDADGHLWVELQAEAASDYVRRGRDVGVRDEPGAGRQGEGVEMPLKPGALGDKVRVLGLDGQPADLRPIGTKGFAAHHAREQLAAEAQPQHRHVIVDRLLEQVGLTPDERLGIVERGELGAERRDHVEVARIRDLFIEVDPKNGALRALLVEPLPQVPGRRRVFVLQDQRLQLALHHDTGLASSLVSSSFSTSRSACARRWII